MINPDQDHRSQIRWGGWQRRVVLGTFAVAGVALIAGMMFHAISPERLSSATPTAKAAFTCTGFPNPLRRALTMYARAANTTRLNYIADHFELAAEAFGDEAASIRQRNPNFRFVNYNSITDNYISRGAVDEHNWLMANATTYGVTDPEDVYLHYSQDTVSRLDGINVTIPGWNPSCSPNCTPPATATSRSQARVAVYYSDLSRRVPAFHTTELRALQRAYHVYLLTQVIRGGGNQYWDGFMFDNASLRYLQTNVQSGGQVAEAPGTPSVSTNTFLDWYYNQGFGRFEQELRTNPPEHPDGRRVWIVPNIADYPRVTDSQWEQGYVNFHPGDVLLNEFAHNPTRAYGQTLPATIFDKNGLAQAVGIDVWEFPLNITSIFGRQGSFTADEAMMNNLGLHWLTRRPNVLTWGFVNIVSQAAWDNNMRGLFDTDLGQPLEDPQVLTTGTDGRGYAYTVYSRRFACGLSVARVRGNWDQEFDAATEVTVTLPGSYFPLDVDGNTGTTTTTEARLRNGQALLFLAQGTTPPPCTPDWRCTDWGQCSGGTQTRTCTDQNSCGTNNGRPAESQSCVCQENWSCGAWSACVNDQQSRACTDLNSCGTTTLRPPLTQSCTNPCTPLWQCTEWGQCTNGTQARACTDQNNCGVNDGRPAESQACSCVPDWQCGPWGECNGTLQSRTCTDRNQCGEQPPQSITVQPCDGTSPAPVTDLRAVPPAPNTPQASAPTKRVTSARKTRLVRVCRKVTVTSKSQRTGRPIRRVKRACARVWKPVLVARRRPALAPRVSPRTILSSNQQTR